MALTAFASRFYQRFEWLTPAVSALFPKLPEHLRAVGVRIYPEAYVGMLGFWLFLSMVLAASVSWVIIFVRLGLLVSFIMLSAPFIVFLYFIAYPYLAALNVGSKLDVEVPFAASYMSVLMSGGIPPHVSLQRLERSRLMPYMSWVSRLIDIYARARGVDVITAMERVSRFLPHKEISELLRGYVSTVRMGGDVVSFLRRRTELLFERMKTRVRALIDRASIMMEAYLAVGVLLALGLYMMFIVSRVLQVAGELLTIEQFLTFGYVILPFISGVFVYAIDTMQFKFPSYETRPYVILALSILPFAVAFMALFGPDLMPQLKPIFGPFQSIRDLLIERLGLSKGFDAAIGLTISLFFLFTPAAVSDIVLSRRERGIFVGAVSFMREAVEIRKTGLSPEKAIVELSERSFGQFSPILRVIAKKLLWGSPLASIYEYLEGRVKNWLTKVGLFTFFEAIEVGGGTPETLDLLARFNEEILTIEQERRSSLRPLLLVPYIGAMILIFTSIALLGFMREAMLQAGRPILFDQFLRTFLPPMVVNTVMMGIVAGKIGEESVAAGFKHAVIMLIVLLLTIVASPYLMTMFVPRT